MSRVTGTTTTIDPGKDVVDAKQDVIPTVPSHKGIPQAQAPVFHREIREHRDSASGRTFKIPGRLSRGGMAAAIGAGYSVQLPVQHEDGTTGMQLITDANQIPSDVELAERFGETDRIKELQAANEAQIQRMQQENQRMADMQKRNAPAIPSGTGAPNTGGKAK